VAIPGLSAAAALTFGVYADLAFNLFSAMNSSPQTTELFADDRSDTLWKYVKIADGAALAFGLFGSLLDKSWWPLLGSLVVIVVMHVMYRHALQAGGGRSAPQNGS
jgi:hypothetical protein